MPMTEDELRAVLRTIPAALPPAPDRISGIEHRVRRHRRRVAASVAAAVAVVLLAVPVVRLVSDASRRDAQPVSPTERTVRDAMMQYAAFVSYWDGKTANSAFGTDPGVEGVVVTATLPPTACTVATPAPGEPGGTQAAWVLGTGSVIPQAGQPVLGSSVSEVAFLWEQGVTTCDPRPASGALLAAAPASAGGLIAADVAAAQALDDPGRPALDVESVYRSIPDDRLTQHGRDVFSAYRKWRAGLDFGTPTEQNERVLQALLDWLSIASVSTSLSPASPVSGPVLLRSTDYVGTAQLPAGYDARWDGTTVCVQGSVAGSPLQHVDRTSYVEPGAPITVLDGSCPKP